ncbi:hypothetical protein KFK09_006535 [Dendrobium nobile]|uniref:Uncharacterized protein n=1 Tax=Dendrobium nobile TaxID=94219 RepID=A0A8T3BPE6_DENNO|nr:hypothetical protein KFK09_006535 [Dendrobium nobile]
MPNFCHLCKTLGHKKLDCPKLVSKLSSVDTSVPQAIPCANSGSPVISSVPNIMPVCDNIGGNDVLASVQGVLDCDFNVNAQLVVDVPSVAGGVEVLPAVECLVSSSDALVTPVMAVLDVVGAPSEHFVPPVEVLNGNSPAVVEIASDTLLSPNAIPFIPGCLVDGFGHTDVNVDSPAVVMVPELVATPDNAATFPAGSSPVLDVVVSNVCGQVVNSDVQGILDPSQNLVNVPVILMDSQNLNHQLGGGVEVKPNGDWLDNSSDCDSDSESYSDTGNELQVVRDLPLKVVSRGKFWNRGGRRR